MENLIWDFGYIGLFVVSFLSATILPLASEAFVALMPAAGYNCWLVLLFATSGNFLGSLTNYYIGKKGSDFLLARYFQLGQEKLRRARELFGRWGQPILFFSWVPVIGDPLTFLGGILNVSLLGFSFWVLLGKTLRYLFVLGIVKGISK